MLLKLIRRYIECDVYASFEVHTTETVEAYRRAIQRFYNTLRVRRAYISLISVKKNTDY